MAGCEERTSLRQSQYSPWGCNLSELRGSSARPWLSTLLPNRNESSVVVQEVPQEQDGCSEESTEWHQCLNNPAENCIRKLLIHPKTPSCSKGSTCREAQKNSLGEEPFQTFPSKQSLTLHQHQIYSHTPRNVSVWKGPIRITESNSQQTPSHSTLLRCYKCFQLHSVQTTQFPPGKK